MKAQYKLILILVLILLMFPRISSAQKEAYIWNFGTFAGIDFNSGVAVPTTTSAMNQNEGCASICDRTTGALLFYTDGMSVWNANDTLMPYGYGLKGNSSSTQSGVIVRQPGSTHIYYIFTVDDQAGTDGLRYSEVDMNLEGGLGDVTSNKNFGLISPSTEKITAVQHANGTDVWVVSHGWNNNTFMSFLVTGAGVIATPVYSSSGTVHTGTNSNTIGYMKISPDGTRLAYGIYGPQAIAEIFDFNTATATVSNPITLTGMNPYGIEFSPDNTKLYVGSYNQKIIYQYDLTAGSDSAIIASQTNIGNTVLNVGALQLAPDQKIYVTKYSDTCLGVINDPNLLGGASNYVNLQFCLPSGACRLGLPTFIQSFFWQNKFTFEDSCFGDSTSFAIVDTVGITSALWDFGDPASGAANSSTLFSPKHVFSSTGAFPIQVIVNFNASLDTVYDTLIINQAPVANLGPDTSLCYGDSLLLDAGNPGASYLWSTGDTTRLYTVNVADSYWVQVSYLYCDLYDSIIVSIYPPRDTPVIVGSVFICPFDDKLGYKILDPKIGSIYDWTIKGGTLISGQGSDSIKVAWDSAGVAMVQVITTDSNGCEADTVYFPVNINVVWTPVAPIGADTFCKADAIGIGYSASYSFGTNYYWHIQGGTIISGDSTSQVIVDWDSIGVDTPGTGFIWYLQENITIDTVCFNPSDTLWVTVFPSPRYKSISGKMEVCEFDIGLVYSVTDSANAGYDWVIEGGTIMSGNGSDSIIVDWDSAGSYLLSVVETNQFGCVGDTIDTMITVFMKPVTTGIFGSIVICDPDSLAIPYGVNGLSTSTYEWIISGGTISSGAGTDSVIINWGMSGNGVIKVVEITADSCFGDTLSITVQLNNPLIEMDLVTDQEDVYTNIDIKWSLYNDSLINGIFLLFRREKHPDSSWILIKSLTAIEYTDPNKATFLTSYNYKVIGFNACGDTIGSATQNSILLNGSNGDQTKNEMALDWNTYINWRGGVDRYEIWRKLDYETDYSIYNSAGLDTTQLYDNGTDGFYYCYKVKAYEKGTGIVSWSNALCLYFDHDITIPNAFSPNGDGVNDAWVIDKIELYPDNELKIFNRWGNLVYKKEGYNNTYRGETTGLDPTSQGLPDGTYFYILSIKNFVTGEETVYKGAVLIFR